MEINSSAINKTPPKGRNFNFPSHISKFILFLKL
jgi:hypothetical protein